MAASILTATIHVSLVVRDFGGDPDEVTRILGITPSRRGREGDALVSRAGRSLGRTALRPFWMLALEADPTSSLEEQVAALAAKWSGAESGFRDLPKGTVIAVFCTVIPEKGLPALSLSRGTVERLAQIGAGIEIDVMYSE